MTHFLNSTGEELLSEHLQVYHVMKSPEEAVAATLVKQLSRFGSVQKQEFSDFRKALEYILPIKSFVTRYLTVQLGEWSLLTCDMRLSDCDSHIVGLSQHLKCEAISAVGHNRGRQFNYYVDGSNRRVIHCYEDGNRWVFFQEGSPLECEQGSNYTLRRKPDRFKPEHVWQCMNHVTGIAFPINWVELRNRPATTLERSLQDLKVSVQLYETKRDVTL